MPTRTPNTWEPEDRRLHCLDRNQEVSAQMTTCPMCGTPASPDSNFCAHCGGKLRGNTGDTTGVLAAVGLGDPRSEDLSADELQAIEALPQGSALLIVLRGPDKGARYLLDSDEAVAGRNPDRDLFLDDITVSRHHCRFTRANAQMTVTDLGSLNGTYVNRTLIDGSVVLRTGDEVQIGKYRLVFYVSVHGLG